MNVLTEAVRGQMGSKILIGAIIRPQMEIACYVKMLATKMKLVKELNVAVITAVGASCSQRGVRINIVALSDCSFKRASLLFLLLACKESRKCSVFRSTTLIILRRQICRR